MKFLFAAVIALTALMPRAHADNLLSQELINKSALNDAEKGMAAASLMLEPTITCISTNEGMGADSEQLRVYFVQIGNVFSASVAIWKTQHSIQVLANFENVESLKSNFNKGVSSSFGKIQEQIIGENDLVVSYGQETTKLGRVTDLKFFDGVVAQQICKLR